MFKFSSLNNQIEKASMTPAFNNFWYIIHEDVVGVGSHVN